MLDYDADSKWQTSYFSHFGAGSLYFIDSNFLIAIFSAIAIIIITRRASVETGFQFLIPLRPHGGCCTGWCSRRFHSPKNSLGSESNKDIIIFRTSLPLFLGGETSVRYQEGFSRNVQFISSLESGQSMFKSHLSLKLETKVWESRSMKVWKEWKCSFKHESERSSFHLSRSS